MAEELRPLKEALLREYGNFADRRIKNIDRGDRFIVDDRTDGDVAADGGLYGWFCSMFVTVSGPDELEMWIENSVPMSEAVGDWFAQSEANAYGNGQRFSLNRGNYESLIDLADRISAIVGRGARYDVAAYKYVAPRTARSLQRLHGVLIRLAYADGHRMLTIGGMVADEAARQNLANSALDALWFLSRGPAAALVEIPKFVFTQKEVAALEQRLPGDPKPPGNAGVTQQEFEEFRRFYRYWPSYSEALA